MRLAGFILLALPALAAGASTDITAEATGPAGAVVVYSIGGGTGEDENGRPIDPQSCTPSSGSTFPLGSTTVVCSATTFIVTVRDTTPPTLTLPSTITTTSKVVLWQATAIDLVDGAVPVSCAPASGSTFPLGRTVVECTARDSRQNTASGNFHVVVDNPPAPPAPPQVPADITAEATSAGGAVVTYRATAPGSGDDENGRPIETTNCAPASGSLFPLGTTNVTCTTEGGTASFKVHVVDTRGPVLALPRDFTVTGTDPTVVTYSATANDIVDGSVVVQCEPPSGATFAAGATTVTCTASDKRSNVSTGTFAVTVVVQTPPPPPQLPDDITAEATGPAGAVVVYLVTGGAGEDENGRPANNANCSPASGSTFPLGTTTVQCTGGSFKITVVDTTAPVLVLPPDITTETANANGTNVTFQAVATDLVDGAVVVSCSPQSSSTFPIGTTVVHCSAADTRNNAANGAFTVTVKLLDQPPVDTEAPTIVSIAASPGRLTPPNGKLVPVTITVEVIDNLDSFPYVGIFEITSNEPAGVGDIVVTSPLTVELRADRSPQGQGRIYTIFVEAIDDAGNRGTAAVTVDVPHDQGNQSVPADTSRKRRAVRR
jgi:large repetitive protein